MLAEIDDQVCTMIRIYQFGEVQYMGYSENASKSDKSPSFSNVEEFCDKLTKRLESLCEDTDYPLSEYATIFACTTKLQPVTSSVLKEFGFTLINEFHSGRYPNNPAYYWIMSVPDVLARLGLDDIGE